MIPVLKMAGRFFSSNRLMIDSFGFSFSEETARMPMGKDQSYISQVLDYMQLDAQRTLLLIHQGNAHTPTGTYYTKA